MILLALLLATGELPDSVTISFAVEAPSPDTLPVRVVGNTPELGEWNHERALTLKRSGSCGWSGTIRVPRGTVCAFNLLRGGWQAEAVSSDGVPLADMWCEATVDTAVRFVVEEWEDVIRPAGRVRGEVVSLGQTSCAGCASPRDVWVVLPRSYAKSSARYPVLYVHDGQDAFDATRSSTGSEWRLDETADSLSRAGRLPEIIIVAVAATQQRALEFADTTFGEAYARFLAVELKPMIDGRFRTRAGRNHTATIGRGLGGLICFLSAQWHPDVFGQAACLSPFLLWGDEKVLTKTGYAAPDRRARLFLSVDSGIADGLLAPSIDAACSMLVHRGWVVGSELQCVGEGSRRPNEVRTNSLVDALLFLFPEDEGENETDNHGVEDDATKFSN